MSADWIITLAALVAALVGVPVVVAQRRRTRRTSAEVRRLRAIVAENDRVRAAFAALETSVETTTATVELTTDIVQITHHAIAAIPFGILEAIPVTRPVTKVVHVIHDQIADGVYGAISGISRAIGQAGHRPPHPSRMDDQPGE